MLYSATWKVHFLGDRPNIVREPCGLVYPQLGKLPDDAVMAHLAAGHGDAVAVLLDRYSRLVLSIAGKIVRDSAEAEDLAQEIFVELCRTAAQFDPDKGTTKMWIIRTAYRRSLNRRRYLEVRGARVGADVEELFDLAASGDYTPNPKLSAYESQRLVRQIFGRLDASQRRVLELVFFHGLSLREVAEKNGCSLESVRHRYYRTMSKLRELLKTPAEPEPTSATAKQETSDASA